MPALQCGPVANLLGAVLEAQDQGERLCQMQRHGLRLQTQGRAMGLDWRLWVVAYRQQLQVQRLAGSMLALLPASNDRGAAGAAGN